MKSTITPLIPESHFLRRGAGDPSVGAEPIIAFKSASLTLMLRRFVLVAICANVRGDLLLIVLSGDDERSEGKLKDVFDSTMTIDASSSKLAVSTLSNSNCGVFFIGDGGNGLLTSGVLGAELKTSEIGVAEGERWLLGKGGTGGRLCLIIIIGASVRGW